MRSYRTYEEWKLATILQANGDLVIGSYRTYEEWKQRWFRHTKKHLLLVLTVPMRNGNPNCEKCNGNGKLFLPYLWGMETTIAKRWSIHTNWFLPYLWGMETSNFHEMLLYRPSVLTVPMRNGNRRSCSSSETTDKFLPYLWGMETQLRLFLYQTTY